MKIALRVPPPVQALIFGALMWLLDKRLPIGQFEFSLQLPVAILFAVLGVALVVMSMLSFRRASTTVDPFHPEEASKLVTNGVFRYSRNPMYVSTRPLAYATCARHPNRRLWTLPHLWTHSTRPQGACKTAQTAVSHSAHSLHFFFKRQRTEEHLSRRPFRFARFQVSADTVSSASISA